MDVGTLLGTILNYKTDPMSTVDGPLISLTLTVAHMVDLPSPNRKTSALRLSRLNVPRRRFEASSPGLTSTLPTNLQPEKARIEGTM